MGSSELGNSAPIHVDVFRGDDSLMNPKSCSIVPASWTSHIWLYILEKTLSGPFIHDWDTVER